MYEGTSRALRAVLREVLARRDRVPWAPHGGVGAYAGWEVGVSSSGVSTVSAAFTSRSGLEVASRRRHGKYQWVARNCHQAVAKEAVQEGRSHQRSAGCMHGAAGVVTARPPLHVEGTASAKAAQGPRLPGRGTTDAVQAAGGLSMTWRITRRTVQAVQASSAQRSLSASSALR